MVAAGKVPDPGGVAMMAPTEWLGRFLLRHCSTATMERLVDPIVTDVRVEAANASRWTSRWITLRASLP